jgi:hypothetical protein
MVNKNIIIVIALVFMIVSIIGSVSAADVIQLGTSSDSTTETTSASMDTSSFTAEEKAMANVIDYARSGGGIPIKVETSTATDWTQFIISLFLGSFMLIFFFGSMISGGLENTAVKLALKRIKASTGRHVVFIKHTSGGLFSQSMIDQDTATKLATAMSKFKGKDFDLILHTPGGEVFSALMISRMLKSYPGKIRTIVPAFAMSGGTLLSLSTDEIFMSPTACLGPVDPQLGSLFKYGSARSWNKIVKFKGKRAEDSSISMAMTGSQYTRTIRDHLEQTMDFGLSLSQKHIISDYLTSGDIEHAYALTPSKLRELGIPVKIIQNTKFMETMMKIISKLAGEGLTFI